MDCLSLKEIKKSISKIKRLKKHCTYKDHLYHSLNRRYKTLDWSKDKFNNAEMKEAFENTALPV